MEVFVVLFAVLSVTLAFWFLKDRRYKNEPPGPMGLPFVGYIPFMSSKPYLDFVKLAEKYGPVFSLRLGSRRVVVLGDFASTKAAFLQDAFIGRPPDFGFRFNRETIETDAFNGLPWKEQRRFSLQTLKYLGYANPKMGQFVMEEIQDLLAKFESTGGRPTNVQPLLAPSMSNNISSLMYGKRLQSDDPVRVMLDTAVHKGAQASGQVAWKIFFPELARVLKTLGLVSDPMSDTFEKLRAYTRTEMDEHEEKLNANDIGDYIDSYLVEIKRKKDPAFCKEVLEDLVISFFGAGSEPVRHSMAWLMLTMAAHQDVQDRVQAEIDGVVGRDRTPSWDDQLLMPYTQATIMELMRWRTPAPINVLRYTLWDTSLNGFTIPKHSYVVANLWAVHHAPEHWGEDAEEFRPERFLSEDGKAVLKSQYFIPFSIGKRACPGELYARIVVYLYFVSIFQKFRVTLPEGSVPDFEGVLGIGLVPKDHQLYIRKRFSPK